MGYYDAKTPVYVRPPGSGRTSSHGRNRPQNMNSRQSAVHRSILRHSLVICGDLAASKLVVAMVTPGSPAANAGVLRGDSVVSIDGVDLAFGNDVNTLNRGLNPTASGESHLSFQLNAAGGSLTPRWSPPASPSSRCRLAV